MLIKVNLLSSQELVVPKIPLKIIYQPFSLKRDLLAICIFSSPEDHMWTYVYSRGGATPEKCCHRVISPVFVEHLVFFLRNWIKSQPLHAAYLVYCAIVAEAVGSGCVLCLIVITYFEVKYGRYTHEVLQDFITATVQKWGCCRRSTSKL